MTTITDILAEAFNRVKNEHGVTLSHADFEHYSGNLQGVTFTSSGIVRMVYPATGAMPSQMPAAPVPWPEDLKPISMPAACDYDELVEITQAQIESLRMPPQLAVPSTPPEGATHIGSLDGAIDYSYFRYVHGILGQYVGDGLWAPYTTLSDATHAELVEQLTPLANPA